MIQRKKRNSSRINLIISAVFHSVLIAVVFFFAAREGLIGKKMKTLAATLVPKEKKAEPPKEKPPEKVETARVENKVQQPVKVATPAAPKTDAAPPPSVAPAAAPPSTSLAAFDFPDGAKEVQSTTDKNVLYKGMVEAALRRVWNRPEGLTDETFVAEAEVAVDPTGHLTSYKWVSGSGNKRWDDSVKQALTQTKGFSKPPPKNFPEKFVVRFDVETTRTEPVLQMSSR